MSRSRGRAPLAILRRHDQISIELDAFPAFEGPLPEFSGTVLLIGNLAFFLVFRPRSTPPSRAIPPCRPRLFFFSSTRLFKVTCFAIAPDLTLAGRPVSSAGQRQGGPARSNAARQGPRKQLEKTCQRVCGGVMNATGLQKAEYKRMLSSSQLV